MSALERTSMPKAMSQIESKVNEKKAACMSVLNPAFPPALIPSLIKASRLVILCSKALDIRLRICAAEKRCAAALRCVRHASPSEAKMPLPCLPGEWDGEAGTRFDDTECTGCQDSQHTGIIGPRLTRRGSKFLWKRSPLTKLSNLVLST